MWLNLSHVYAVSRSYQYLRGLPTEEVRKYVKPFSEMGWGERLIALTPGYHQARRAAQRVLRERDLSDKVE